MLYKLCSNSLEDDSIGNTGDQEAAKSSGSTIDGEQQSNIKKVVHLSPDDSTLKESRIQNFLWRFYQGNEITAKTWKVMVKN